MRRAALSTLVLLFVCICPLGTSIARPEPPLRFVERVIGAAPDARLPLVVAMHGLGSRPEEVLTLFDGLDVPVRVVAPRAPDSWAVGTSWYPVDDPQRAPSVVRRRAQLVASLLDHVRERRPTRGLPIVTGFSQGGVLSFALAAYHPRKLAAAVPIAGMLPASLGGFRKAPRGFRVIALHGEADERIRHAQAEQTVARLRKVGTKASLIGYPEVGHTIPPAMLARYHAVLREELARVER